MYKSKLAASLVPYVPGEQPKSVERLIKLNTNENPYPPSPRVARALRELDASRLRLYPDPTAEALRAAIAEREGVATENVFVGNGIDEVLSLAFAAYFDSGSLPVLFADVTYSFYKVFCSLYDINYDELPLREDMTLCVDDYIGRKAAGVVIADPNAPTALSVAESDIRRLLEAFHDRVVILDEAYVDFSRNGSLVPLIGEYPNLVVVKTFSKSRSLAGARCGYAIAEKSLIDTLRTVKNCFNSYTINAVTATIARESVLDDEYFAECTAKIVRTRRAAAEGLAELGFELTDSDANFLFVRHPDMDGKRLQAELRARNIIVRRFDLPRISDHLRITVGTDEDMQTLVRACREILSRN